MKKQTRSSIKEFNRSLTPAKPIPGFSLIASPLETKIAYQIAGQTIVGGLLGMRPWLWATQPNGLERFKPALFDQMIQWQAEGKLNRNLTFLIVTLAAGVAAIKRRFPASRPDEIWTNHGQFEWHVLNFIAQNSWNPRFEINIRNRDELINETFLLVDDLWPDIRNRVEIFGNINFQIIN